MHFLACTVLMAICLSGAYAIPKRSDTIPGETDKMDAIQLLLAQMRSNLIDTRALTSVESSCATKYNNRIQQINNLLTNHTNSCYENANLTLAANIKTANQTVANIRSNLQKVQQKLANCSSIANVSIFLNCTTTSFDTDIHLMDAANSQAYQVETQIAANQSQVAVVYRSCVSAAIASGKTNLTQAANEYQSCLSNISNQHMWLELN